MTDSILQLVLGSRKAERQGYAELERLRRARLAEMVAFARVNSPRYRDLYKDLPESVQDATELPVTSKAQLMAHFDDWVTDREVKAEKVRKFVENPDLIGAKFLGKYTVAITSGTTGSPGLILLDHHDRAVTTAWGLRTLGAWLTAAELIKIVAAGLRMAVVAAMGSHFAVATSTAALRKTRLGERVRMFSALAPLPDLVAQLNSFRPTILTGYASLMTLLANEQEAERLHINPILVLPGSEALASGQAERIARIFDAKVRTRYAATECFFMAVGCEHGWLHVNSDWVLLEPVDSDYRPVPPGHQSHTLLVSNLANRIQPILRYDLGDSVLQRPDRCPCGNPLSAIQVQGRTADLLTFPAAQGENTVMPPLVLEMAISSIPGIAQFQIVQSDPTTLGVRLKYREGTDPDRVWDSTHTTLERVFTEHGIRNVSIHRAEEAPARLPSGKLRTVIPLR